MLEAATVAFENLLVPTRLGYLFIGVLMGLALGAIPGLGGLVGLAILLPFTFDMDSFEAFAIMIGLISVTSTSDTIPSVLFGVPGTSASQATILDGHPMARKARPVEPSAAPTWHRSWAACSGRWCWRFQSPCSVPSCSRSALPSSSCWVCWASPWSPS